MTAIAAMKSIALPERKILVPRLEFPRWLRFPRGVGDERALNMLTPLGGTLTPLGVSVTNPLASVPWVAQWKFNNDGNDSIGANHLTNNNSATFTTGKLGGATGATQLVAASTQYWSVADNAALSMGDLDFTICAWVYLDTTGTFSTILCKNKTAGDNEEYVLFYNGTNFRLSVADGTHAEQSVIATSAGAAVANTWYCVVAWHNSVANTLNISVNNGTTDSTAYTLGSWNSTGEFTVGAIAVSHTSPFNGRIDNVCIAKSVAGGGGVLTAAQRTAFYNNGNGTEQLT